MNAILDFINGKKTYFIAFIVAVEAGLRYAGIEIPAWVDTALAALGLTAMRAAIPKSGT